MKRYILLSIALVMLASPVWTCDDCATDDELKGWWSILTTDQRLEQLRNLDLVEHEVPILKLPDYVVVVTKDEVIASPLAPLEISVGHLGWSVELDPIVADYDPLPTRTWLGGLLVGTTAGVFLTLLYKTLIP